MFNFINRVIESVNDFLFDQPEQGNLQKVTTVESSKQLKTEIIELDYDQQKTSKDLEIKEVSLQPEKLTLQQQLDSLEDGARLQLWPAGGEYKGPIIINRPLSLDGQGATIWALTGPVISIESEGVKLRNLRVEVTGEKLTISPEDRSAIVLNSAPKFQFNHVEVRGLVMGIPEEEGEWKYPNSLHLGQLAYGREHNLLLRIIVPVACKITADISGLELSPRHLTPGANEIRLQIEKLPKDTLINGNIFLVSASLKRRISLTAHILSLPEQQLGLTGNNVIWQAKDWVNIVHSPEPKPEPKPEPIEGKSNQLPAKNQGNHVEVIPRYTESSNLPSKSRLVQSQPLSPLFENQPSPKESLEEQEKVAASESTESSQTINPIFEPKSSPTESTNQQQKSPDKKSSEKSPTINPIFEPKSSPTESTNQQQKSPDKKSSEKSQLINPLFESNPPLNEN